MHPDFGGEVTPGGAQIYGFPYAVVDGTLLKRTVQFQYAGESDGVNHATGASVPFYPIPDGAVTQAHWIESEEPGTLDLRSSSDRHLLIVDRDNRWRNHKASGVRGSADWRKTDRPGHVSV